MLIVIILAALISFFTCPDRDDHVNEIHSAVQAAISSSEEGAMIQLTELALGGDGNMMGTMAVREAIREMRFTCDNYLLFSVGTGVINGKRQTISFGCFGMVFILK